MVRGCLPAWPVPVLRRPPPLPAPGPGPDTTKKSRVRHRISTDRILIDNQDPTYAFLSTDFLDTEHKAFFVCQNHLSIAKEIHLKI